MSHVCEGDIILFCLCCQHDANMMPVHSRNETASHTWFYFPPLAFGEGCWRDGAIFDWRTVGTLEFPELNLKSAQQI
jgi:hypothetical protein